MHKFDKVFKTALPHIVAIIVFLILSYVYFLPASQGKVLHGTDNITAKSQQGEIVPFVALTGEYCAWTNAAFAGMPSYTIWIKDDAPLIVITQFISLFAKNGPISYLFIAMLSFYIFLLCYGVNPWISIIGSLAYAFSSYFMVIIGAGHVTKVLALAYMPGIFGGIYLVYKQKKLLLGASVMALFLAMEIGTRHYQIVYYTIFITVAIGIHFLIRAIKRKTLAVYLKGTGILMLAAILAGLTSIGSIWTTKEYAAYSTRGNSILSSPINNGQTKAIGNGLDFEYATQWSYGIAETFNILVPNFRGGSSSAELSENSEIYKLYSKSNRAQAKKIIKQLPLYWGPQPFTEGPAYMGALTLFLFVFAMFLLKNKERWWVLMISIFAIMLAWGNHFEAFNRIIFDYFPLYNKFRAVTTTLFILQFTIPFMAILAINKMVNKFDKTEVIKALKWSFGIIGGILLVFVIIPGIAGSYTGANDAQYLENQAFMKALMADRQSILRADAIRSLFYVIAGVILIILFIYKKINKIIFGSVLGILILLDLALLDTRFVSHDDFKTVRFAKNTFTPSVADISIFNFEVKNAEVSNGINSFLDKYKSNPTIKTHESPELLALNLTTNYKVLNIAGGINFSDAKTSYFHKSLSGYSPAKLRRYQDLIDRRILEQQIRNFVINMQSDQNPNSYSVLNMLNTKYIIISPDQTAFYNKNALGNVWFVKNIQWVDNADDEFNAMATINPRENAAINIEFKGSQIDNLGFDPDAEIKLKNYKPHILTYESSTKADMLAVFSEIYYPKGWQVYVDNKQVDYLRANYLFRAMVVPAGNHTIEFKFEPKSYLLGNKINKYASLFLLLSFICIVAFSYWRFLSTSQDPSIEKEMIH